MKNRILNLAVVLFALTFLISGCQQELLRDTETQHTATQNHKFQVVKIQDIPNVVQFIKKQTGRSDLKIPMGGKKINALAKGAIEFSELETDFILKVTKEDAVYYVFGISNASDENTLYNFEVKEVEREVVRAELIEFASDEPFDEEYSNLSNFNGKVSSYNDKKELVNISYFQEGINGDCPPTAPPGSGGGGGTPGVPIDYPIGGGGWIGGWGGGGGGGSSAGGSEGCDPNKWQISYYIHEGGGLSGPIIGEVRINGCGVTKKVLYLAATAKSPLSPNCDDGSGVVILPGNPRTPCGKLQNMTSEKTFKNNVTSLEGMTGYDSERGYRMGHPIAANGQTGIQNQFLQNMPGTRVIELKAFSNTYAILHTHYDGLFPIFSPGDIIFFNSWIVWAQNWNAVATNTPKIDLNNLTFVVVTSYGTYILKFDGTNVVPLPTYSQTELDKLNESYIDDYMNKTHINGSFDTDKLETQFLKFVGKNMNMTGLKLYKTDNNGTNTEIYLENGKRKTSDCP